MKLYIRCQSKFKTDVLADLEEHTLPCMEEMAKIWLFPNTEYVNHWRTEIWSHYKKVSKVKPRNKYPKAQAIFNNTWNLNGDKVRSMMKWAIAHESELTPDPDRNNDEQTLKDIMETYFALVADKLSKDGVIDPSDSYEKLEELGL